MWPWQNKKRKQKHIKAWIKNTNNDDFYTQIEFHSYMREQTKKKQICSLHGKHRH